jgi:hypothetical protein
MVKNFFPATFLIPSFPFIVRIRITTTSFTSLYLQHSAPSKAIDKCTFLYICVPCTCNPANGLEQVQLGKGVAPSVPLVQALLREVASVIALQSIDYALITGLTERCCVRGEKLDLDVLRL